MPEYKYAPSNGSSLYNHLASAEASELFHEKHSKPMAHPSDIYSEKLEQVVDLYARLVKKFTQSDEDNECCELIKNLIEATNEFYDLHFSIIKCFTQSSIDDDDNSETQLKIINFLKKSNKEVFNKFYAPTKGEHTLVRDIANALKHQHSKIMLIDLHNFNGKKVYGFFIQTIVGTNDLRGPSREIHKMYKEQINTAFSFNHFLLNILGRIMCYSEKLDKALFSSRTSTNTKKKIPSNILDKLMVSASSLQEEFFPDEYHRPFAKIKNLRDSYIITFPARYKINKKNTNTDFITNVKMHIPINQRTSESHQFLPYLQLTIPKSELM